MAKRSIMHMLDPMIHNSPFDINMAVDAGYDVIVPYQNVQLEQVSGLTQDAIFSRGPAGVKKPACSLVAVILVLLWTCWKQQKMRWKDRFKFLY